MQDLTCGVWCRSLFDVEGVYFKDVQRLVHMDRFCSWKYLVYIESYGYSASLKYRLACGSVLFQGEAALSLDRVLVQSQSPPLTTSLCRP